MKINCADFLNTKSCPLEVTTLQCSSDADLMLKTRVWAFGVLSLSRFPKTLTWMYLFVAGAILSLKIMNVGKILSNYVTPFSFSGRRKKSFTSHLVLETKFTFKSMQMCLLTNTGNRPGVLFDIWDLLRKQGINSSFCRS